MLSKWRTDPPELFEGSCLVTMKVGNRRWVTIGWAERDDKGELKMMHGAIIADAKPYNQIARKK